MKTYVITLSKQFLSGHKEAGKPTNFRDKFLLGIGCPDCKTQQDLSGENISPCNSCIRACMYPKIHTMRSNYSLWEKRISEVERGEACLSIREWTGNPYHSKQIQIARLTKDDGVGIQKLEFLDGKIGLPRIGIVYQRKTELASNDGLIIWDWEDWFRNYDLSKSMAIIHFTKFRYEQ
ncbi:hypothetical protein [Odoribacter splanchnicus]|jgi:hypothetical protein|uniref:hypothetical protein n=1 Tax=Odoribacter splanchnicus TaxID=28118 RepID=UPI000E4A6A41|nr:hypothetical protein [Odoribacter splanchnicus]RHA39480.1 hypothetical protein DW936_15285 [Odoribacter splanchnicus]